MTSIHDTPFAQLSQRSQIALLRPLARHACHEFGVIPQSIRCINHGFNTTFAIKDPRGHTYALRINTHSTRTSADIAAEAQWITALAEDAGIHVAKPLQTASGQAWVHHEFAPLAKALDITMAPWLPGRIVGGRPSRRQCRQLGALAARMHQQSIDWQPTHGVHFPAVNGLLMNSTDHLSTAPENVLSADVQRLIHSIRPHIEDLYARLNQRMRPQAIHGDLHTYNVMWHDDQLAVLDFDDAGLGLAVQDIAISLYHARDIAYADAEFTAGYTDIAPWPDISTDELETLMMGRGLLLLNDMLVMSTPADHAFRPEYIRRMHRRMQHFVATGTFALLM